jgi:DNA polymerase-3 subunit beta
VRLEVEAEALLPAGAWVVAPVLAQVLKGLSGAVDLEFSDGELVVVSGRSRTTLKLAVSRTGPEWVEGTAVTADGDRLAAALRAVLPATAAEEYRAVFRGVQFEHEGRFRLVATDGFRLAYYDLEEPEGPAGRAYVVNAPGLKLLERVLAAGPVTLRQEGGRLRVDGEGFRFQTGLLEGTFPDYERVLPQSDPVAEADVDAAALRGALERLMPLADRTSPAVALSFGPDGVGIVVEGDYGRGEDRVPAQVSGKVEVAVNPQYFLDALSPIEGQAVLRFSGRWSPFTIRPAVGGFTGVVVPLRTADYYEEQRTPAQAGEAVA